MIFVLHKLNNSQQSGFVYKFWKEELDRDDIK